jgi:hypothetical protein
MKILFKKQGLVTYGTSEQGQEVNLQDPFGEPLNMTTNIETNEVVLTAIAYDDRNSVVRSFPIQLDDAAKIAYLTFFNDHIRRLAKDTYPDFVGLVEIDISL